MLVKGGLLSDLRSNFSPTKTSLDKTGTEPTGKSGLGGEEAAIIGGLGGEKDEISCSVFAPFEVAPGDGFLIQAFVHLVGYELERLAARAREAQRLAAKRGEKKLGQIARGQEVSFHLQMPGFDVDEPSQSLVWQGEVDSVQFSVNAPKTCELRSHNCKVSVIAPGFIGHICFTLDVVARSQIKEAVPPPNSYQNLVQYQKAFISYASEDLPEVLRCVRILTLLNVECFQDVLSLKPGERWEKMLYRYIDESDVFFLFWSAAANESEWVEKEVRYALNCKGGNDETPPEILPVVLQGPPEVPPPSYLSEYHFNDPIALIIQAEVVRRRARDEH